MQPFISLATINNFISSCASYYLLYLFSVLYWGNAVNFLLFLPCISGGFSFYGSLGLWFGFRVGFAFLLGGDICIFIFPSSHFFIFFPRYLNLAIWFAFIFLSLNSLLLSRECVRFLFRKDTQRYTTIYTNNTVKIFLVPLHR